MIDRSKFGPISGPGFDPAPVVSPFPGPPAAARALALALGCPDLFLIEAPPGPNRDGFAAALAANAARLGRTVLLITPDPPAADALISHLSADRDPPAARALGPNENVDGLPEVVRPRCTLAFRDRAKAEARQRSDGFATEVRAFGTAAEAARAEWELRKAKRDRIPCDLDARRATLRQKVVAAKEQLANLAPLREAKEQGRIWSGLFWKATFTGGVANRVSDLEKQIASCESEACGLDEQAALALKFDSEIAVLAQKIKVFEAEGDAVRARLPEAGTAVPTPVHPIVVAPLTAVGHDPATGISFDHVVMTYAERASPETLETVQRLAPRCVLIGSRFGRQAGPLFAELFAERDTGLWMAETGRLVFRVAPVPGNRRNDLRCEPLVDRPEIELRFLGKAGCEVELAEVAFPDAMSPAEARTWLAAELGILRLSPCGPHHWHDGPGPHRACWHLADTVPEAPKAWAELGQGIRVLVTGTGADAVSSAVTFDAEQWDRPAAEAWLADALADAPPRAVRLPRVPVSAPHPTPKPEPVAVG